MMFVMVSSVCLSDGLMSGNIQGLCGMTDDVCVGE